MILQVFSCYKVLTVAVATENFYNRLNAPLEIESQGFCSIPMSEEKEDISDRAELR